MLSVIASGVGGGMVADLLVILVAAALVAIALQRMRLAVIPGYLITGVLVGPGLLGIVDSPERLDGISHLAIILLMFGIGLQLHLSALKHHFVRMLLVGGCACAVPVLIGWPLTWAAGLGPAEGLTLCLALSLSSTAVVLRVLAQRHELNDMSGRLCLSVLVVQDIAVLAMFAAMPALAEWASGTGVVMAAPDTRGLERLVIDVATSFGGVVGLIVLFRYVCPRLLEASLRGRSVEVLTVASLAAALSLAFGVQRLGFSLEMGSFLAGFLLAGTPFRHHLSGQIRPLRDILIAVFFTTVGMKLDPALLAESWWIVVAGVALMIVIKSATISTVAWAFGATGPVAMKVGLSVGQAGEFSLVLIGVAQDQGVLRGSTAGIAIAVVVVSLVLTPSLIQLGSRLADFGERFGVAPWLHGAALADTDREAPEPFELPSRVIVAGFGMVGRCLVENLERSGYLCTIIELNSRTVRQEAGAGRSIVFGDVASDEVLDSAGLDTAQALILTVPDADAVLRACTTARRRRTDLAIIARATHLSRTRAILDAGADLVAVDEMACADAMLGMVTLRLREDQPTEAAPELQAASRS